MDFWRGELMEWGVERGEIVAVRGDYSRDVCALVLALALAGTIVVPLASSSSAKVDEFLAVAQADSIVSFEPSGIWRFERRAAPGARPPLTGQPRRDSAP